MNNQDWNVRETELEKAFYFDTEANARKFLDQLRKLAKSEHHHPEVEKRSGNVVMVHIPVSGPERYEEEGIRLANLINRIAN
ncbi:MAG: 4a-hydroxytetrahydrobiopterin dehydratase [Chlorobi bacterium]|nr:4a-hydroxytetrahydrobiopterin dehydratase [Chlorobiota bacterium]